MPMQIQAVSKSFGTDTILENISMTISDNQKVGLIGANGAGKTTLLKIISGELKYDSGSIFTPKDAEIGFLKQTAIADSENTMSEEIDTIFADVNTLENEMRELENKMSHNSDEEEAERLMKAYASASARFDAKGGFDIQTTVKTVINGMGFDRFDLEKTKVSTLSGGEKTKFAFAKLLLRHPGVLLLDEPTNHLDFRTMQWLEMYLKSYRGIVIAVSHDRYFLDSVSDCIYEIERGTAVKYSGNYSAYLDEKKKNYEIAMKHYEQQNAEIQKLEDYVERNRVRASTAKMAKSKQKAIDRMEVLEKPVLYSKECKFNFDIEYPSYKDVLECENLELAVGDGSKIIADNITFEVKRGEKVAIVGANGIGKSTLLKTLIGINKTYNGFFEFGKNTNISFYDQEQKLLHENKTVLNEIWDRFPRMDESEVRTLLGTVLFTNDDVYKEVSLLSGGERARLMLLVIMLQKANTMLLDEPTNHLDLPSKEALDAAVKNFEGSVILVSHDRYFLNKTADRILELTSDGITSYDGNYDSYLEAKNLSEIVRSDKESVKKVNSASAYENEKRKAANKRNLEKKLKICEDEISDAEQKNDKIKAAIADAGSDYGKVSELYKESQKTEVLLAKLYESWEELSNLLENGDF